MLRRLFSSNLTLFSLAVFLYATVPVQAEDCPIAIIKSTENDLIVSVENFPPISSLKLFDEPKEVNEVDDEDVIDIELNSCPDYYGSSIEFLVQDCSSSKFYKFLATPSGQLSVFKDIPIYIIGGINHINAQDQDSTICSK